MLIQPLSSFAPGFGREVSRVAGGQFRVPTGPGSPRAALGPGSTAALASLPTLLAVQEVALDTGERRQRAVRRGEAILAALGDLQLALLGAGDGAASLDRLRAAVAQEEAVPEEPELAQILAAVEVRAAVELAKQERS